MDGNSHEEVHLQVGLKRSTGPNSPVWLPRLSGSKVTGCVWTDLSHVARGAWRQDGTCLGGPGRFFVRHVLEHQDQLQCDNPVESWTADWNDQADLAATPNSGLSIQLAGLYGAVELTMKKTLLAFQDLRKHSNNVNQVTKKMRMRIRLLRPAQSRNVLP